MAISLGNQEFLGNSNFPIAMVANLATQLTGKNITLTQNGNMVAILQGGSQIGSFDLSDSHQEVWFALASVLFSGATARNIHVADRIIYSDGYSNGIDWRDMAESTTINENRYADGSLTVSVNLAAFTIDGFGADTIRKVVFVQLQRNDAESGTGAMIELGVGNTLMRVNTSNQIEFNTTVGSGVNNWSILGGGIGSYSLGSGINYLIFEMVPIIGSAGDWEIVAAFYDGTDYHQANNINFTPDVSINGDDLGFSRSSVQRGQVLRFSAINSPGYITHANLEQLLRNHVADKWNFGFARLIEGSDSKEIVLTTKVEIPLGSQINGQQIAQFQRHVVYDTVATPVSSVTLPSDPDWTTFDAIFLEMQITDGGGVGIDEVRSRYMSLATFKRSDITDHVIRFAGDRDLSFNPTTRVISVVGATTEITQCAIIKGSQ